MNQPDPHAHLRAAFTAGCRIQAWHLNDGAANSNDGRWDTLTAPEGREPEFGCAPHLYRVHPEDEAKALAVWDFRMPTMHQPDGVRFYIERLVSNTDPAGMVRENLLLREEVTRLSSLISELGQEVGAEQKPFAYMEPVTFNASSPADFAEALRKWPDDYDDWFPVYSSPAHTSEARGAAMTGAGDSDDLPAFLEWVANEVVRRDTRAGNFAEGLAQSLRGRAHILRIVKKDAAMRQEAGSRE